MREKIINCSLKPLSFEMVSHTAISLLPTFTYGGMMETGPSHLSLYVISGLLSYVFESQMLILTFFLILK